MKRQDITNIQIDERQHWDESKVDLPQEAFGGLVVESGRGSIRKLALNQVRGLLIRESWRGLAIGDRTVRHCREVTSTICCVESCTGDRIEGETATLVVESFGVFASEVWGRKQISSVAA